MMSEEPERKWKEVEHREEEDKLAFDLSGGQESVKENIRSRARKVKEMNLECFWLFKEEVRILENVPGGKS